jgi:hypothetical protein
VSNHLHRGLPRLFTAVLLALPLAAPLAKEGTGRAVAQHSPIDAWARWAVSRGRWAGPVVDFPERTARPDGRLYSLHSWTHPLHVHAPETIELETARRALEALESGYDTLLAAGWPVPVADGGYGDTIGFDLYLQPGASRPVAAHVEAPLSWALLDGASVFAVIDPVAATGRLQACVIDGLTRAALLGQDPAEAPSWRRATGAYVSWLITGEFGCDDEVAQQQQNSWRGWITDAPESGSGGALFLAMLSEREDGGTGTFVRDLWQFARQRTRETKWLRASPDLWEVTERALSNAGESLEEIVVDFAVARYFAGIDDRRRGATHPSLRSLPPNAAVPVAARIGLADLPEHLPVALPPLEVYGSSYAIVDTAGAPSPTRLKIWLRGEYGVRWSLSAVRLSAGGREIGRTTAPATRNPKSFLAVELSEEAHSVLLVVTNLGVGVPDADRDERFGRSHRLIVDVARDR